MLIVLFVTICFSLVVNQVNCDKDDKLLLEIPKGEFEIEGNVQIRLKANGKVSIVSNWSVSEIMSIDSEESALGLSVIALTQNEKQMVTTFHRYNGNTSNHLIIKDKQCVDLINFTDGTGHFGWFDHLLLKGIFYFYHLIIKHHDKVEVIFANKNKRKTLRLAPVGLYLDQNHTGIHDSTLRLIFNEKLESVSLFNLESVDLYLEDDDIIYSAKISIISVQNVSSHGKVIQPTIDHDCPYYFHEDKKFPGHNIIQDYWVKVTETFSNQSVGLQSQSELQFIISTMEEISWIKKFGGGFLKESITDYRLGVKYVLDDNKCRIEPIPLDSDTISLTNGSLSFNKIAWMNIPYKYFGQSVLEWESKNVTFDIWRNVSTKVREDNIFYEKVITNSYMINKALYDKTFNFSTKYENTFNGYILAVVMREFFPIAGSKSSISQIRKFENFTRQLSTDGEISSLTIGNQFITHCYNSDKSIDNITINLKIGQIDNLDSNGTEPDPLEMKRSLARIITNLLHVSHLRIVSINVTLESKIYVNAAIKMIEAVDLIGSHTKNYLKFDSDILEKFETIGVEDEYDCLREQTERPDSFVISCNSLGKNWCLSLSSGQALPSESLNGSVDCLVYNSSHDTLVSFAKETPLTHLMKPLFKLSGIKFLVNKSRFKIIDAWTSSHENVIKPPRPSKTRNETYGNKVMGRRRTVLRPERIKVKEIINPNANTTIKIPSYPISTMKINNHDHLYRHWFLIILSMAFIGLIVLYLQKLYSRSTYSEPDFVSLTTFERNA